MVGLSEVLSGAGLGEQFQRFDEAGVDLDVFLFLTDSDLTNLGFKVGPRRKLLHLQEQLRKTEGINEDSEDERDRLQQEEEDESSEGGGGDSSEGEEDEEGLISGEKKKEEQVIKRSKSKEVITDRSEKKEKEKDKEKKKKKGEDSEKKEKTKKKKNKDGEGKKIKSSKSRELESPPETPQTPQTPHTPQTPQTPQQPEPKQETKQEPKQEVMQESRPQSQVQPQGGAPLASVNRMTSSGSLHSMSQQGSQGDFIKNKDKSKMIKLETVPSISADEIEGADCQGWLWKQGGVVKSWKKRWFVLKGPCLYYFPTPTGTKAKGVITLPSYQIITAAAEQVTKEFAFQAYHPSARTYVFVANNKHDMNHWIHMMHNATSLTVQLSAMNLNQVNAVPMAEGAPKNRPLPPNAHVIYNIFDVKITRSPEEIIGLDVKVNKENGTLVTKIHENSPASRAGMIKVGDQIVKIDGIAIAGMKTTEVVEILRDIKESCVLSLRRF